MCNVQWCCRNDVIFMLRPRISDMYLSESLHSRYLGSGEYLWIGLIVKNPYIRNRGADSAAEFEISTALVMDSNPSRPFR